MIRLKRLKSLLVLWIVFVTGISASASDFEFGGLGKGQPAPFDISYLSETNFIKFEIFETVCYAAISNQVQYKIIDKAQGNIIFRARAKGLTGSSGGVLILIGTALILTRNESMTKIGIPLVGTGGILVGVSFAL